MHVTIKQLEGRQCTHLSLLLYCCCELLLTPNIIYASKYINVYVNNDAVFPGLSAETARQLPTSSRQETFISMMSNLKKNTDEEYEGI